MPPKKTNTQAKHWVFTLNNPTGSTPELLSSLKIHLAYYAWQLELSPSGTPHIQGYIGFADKQYFTRVTSYLPGARIAMSADPPAAWIYCQKDETRIPGGIMEFSDTAPPSKTSQLKGNRWKVYQDYTKTHTWIECFDEFPDLVCKETAMRKIFERKFPKNEMKRRQVELYFGPPEVGKTLFVSNKLEGLDYYKQTNDKWWDNYAYEDIVWIDDMQSGRFLRHIFLNMCDFGGVRVETKGGTALLKATKIFITSNFHPATWFEKEEKQLQECERGRATMRRMEAWKMDPPTVEEDGTVVPNIELLGNKTSQQQGNNIPAAVQATLKALLQKQKASSEQLLDAKQSVVVKEAGAPVDPKSSVMSSSHFVEDSPESTHVCLTLSDDDTSDDSESEHVLGAPFKKRMQQQAHEAEQELRQSVLGLYNQIHHDPDEPIGQSPVPDEAGVHGDTGGDHGGNGEDAGSSSDGWSDNDAMERELLCFRAAFKRRCEQLGWP